MGLRLLCGERCAMQGKPQAHQLPVRPIQHRGGGEGAADCHQAHPCRGAAVLRLQRAGARVPHTQLPLSHTQLPLSHSQLRLSTVATSSDPLTTSSEPLTTSSEPLTTSSEPLAQLAPRGSEAPMCFVPLLLLWAWTKEKTIQCFVTGNTQGCLLDHHAWGTWGGVMHLQLTCFELMLSIHTIAVLCCNDDLSAIPPHCAWHGLETPGDAYVQYSTLCLSCGHMYDPQDTVCVFILLPASC